ncbi:MAG TPA: tetratricopeptide repeat protein, partial [Phycisphaerales bacterium]|nr:tetratricopeptide repeat protein [Phycisphaerales bacterium]
YDLFTISRQAKRRREILAAGRVQMKPARPVSNEQALCAEALAKARAAVSSELSAGRPEAAIAPYRELLEQYGESPEASTLSRTAQYQLGLQLYASGENAMAIRALSDFIRAYPDDAETPAIRVLLGRLYASEGETDRARAFLTEAAEQLADERLAAIAREELASLGASTGDQT